MHRDRRHLALLLGLMAIKGNQARMCEDVQVVTSVRNAGDCSCFRISRHEVAYGDQCASKPASYPVVHDAHGRKGAVTGRE